MELFSIFLIGVVISYAGSIPPGTINISVLQYGLKGQKSLALRFGLGACLVEFVYAAATVKFQLFLTEHTIISEHFQMFSALVLLSLGILNLTRKRKPKDGAVVPASPKAFRKGLLMGIANLMVIPFWLGVTAYLQNTKLIVITWYNLFIYVTGISIGTFLLVVTVAYLSHRFQKVVENKNLVSKIPGIVFLSMGLYSFYLWINPH